MPVNRKSIAARLSWMLLLILLAFLFRDVRWRQSNESLIGQDVYEQSTGRYLGRIVRLTEIFEGEPVHKTVAAVVKYRKPQPGVTEQSRYPLPETTLIRAWEILIGRYAPGRGHRYYNYYTPGYPAMYWLWALLPLNLGWLVWQSTRSGQITAAWRYAISAEFQRALRLYTAHIFAAMTASLCCYLIFLFLFVEWLGNVNVYEVTLTLLQHSTTLHCMDASMLVFLAMNGTGFIGGVLLARLHPLKRLDSAIVAANLFGTTMVLGFVSMGLTCAFMAFRGWDVP